MSRLSVFIIWLAWTSCNYTASKNAIVHMYNRINAEYEITEEKGGLVWTNSDRAITIFVSGICPLGTAFAGIFNMIEYFPYGLNLNGKANW